LRLYDVHAGDGLGDGVLDLNAGVHLDEVKLAVLVHQKFDRPGVLVADLFEAAADGLTKALAHLGRDLEAGRLFDELLMAALNGALALEEGTDAAVLVGQHLKLDVAGVLDELFHVEFAVAKGVGGLGGSGQEEVGESLGVAHDAHAAPAAAGLGLDDDRVADLLGAGESLLDGGQNAVGAGQDGHMRALHRLPRFFLFTHEASDFRGRSDELDVGGAADLGKVGVLAEQAVAGMDGVDIGDFGGADDGRDVEITLGQTRRADADGFVGKADVEGVAVGLAVDGDGANAQLTTGVDDAQCDFAAIGDENFSKHG